MNNKNFSWNFIHFKTSLSLFFKCRHRGINNKISLKQYILLYYCSSRRAEQLMLYTPFNSSTALYSGPQIAKKKKQTLKSQGAATEGLTVNTFESLVEIKTVVSVSNLPSRSPQPSSIINMSIVHVD